MHVVFLSNIKETGIISYIENLIKRQREKITCTTSPRPPMAEPGVISAELNSDVLNPIEVLHLFGYNRTFYLKKQIRTFKTQSGNEISAERDQCPSRDPLA